ncbi:unnamed protein product, partial [Vitis vinifera]
MRHSKVSWRMTPQAFQYHSLQCRGGGMRPSIEKLGAQTNQLSIIKRSLLFRQFQIQQSIYIGCYTTTRLLFATTVGFVLFALHFLLQLLSSSYERDQNIFLIFEKLQEFLPLLTKQYLPQSWPQSELTETK